MWVKNKDGFTIVELLIVVVVIAILAAITIVAYNGINNRAKESAIQSNLSQQAKKLLVWKVQNGEQYPASLADAQAQGMLGSASGVQYITYIPSPALTDFCATAERADGARYSVTSRNASPVTGECVTNLATDPAATNTAVDVGGAGWRTSRWFGSTGAAGSYSLQTGVSDAPAGTGLTTYARKNWTAINTGSGGDLGYENTRATSTGVSTQGMPFQGGAVYTLSSYLRSSTNHSNANLSLFWHDAAGAYVSASASGNRPLVANQWFRMSVTATVPATATSAGIVSDLDGQIASVGQNLDGTGLMITQGASLYSYGDGNSPGWFWNGAANNSTSTGPAVAQ